MKNFNIFKKNVLNQLVNENIIEKKQENIKLNGAQQIVCQGIGLVPSKMTFSALHQIPNKSFAIQFEVANLNKEDGVVYHSVFAISSSVNDWVTPTNAEGRPDHSLWQKITMNQSDDLIVSASADDKIPARALTDIMPFHNKPLKRIDGGDGICIFYRQYAISGNNTVRNFDSTVGLWSDFPNGQNPSQFSQTYGGGWMGYGNFCESNFDLPLGGVICIPASAPHALLPFVSIQTITIMSVGDSILSGVASRGFIDKGVNGVGLQVVKRLNTYKRSVLHVNEARSGMKSVDFIKQAHESLINYRPDIILMEASSPNDQPSVNDIDMWQGFQRSMQFAAIASQHGAKVIIITQPPYAGKRSLRRNVESEQARIFANNLVKMSGVPYVDSDKVLGIGGGPVNYIDGMSDDSDMIHPNEQGAGALAEAVISILKEKFGIEYQENVININDDPIKLSEISIFSKNSEITSFGNIFIFNHIFPKSFKRIPVLTSHGTYLFIDEENRKMKHAKESNIKKNIFAIRINDIIYFEYVRSDGSCVGCFPKPLDPRLLVNKSNAMESFFKLLRGVSDDKTCYASFSYKGVYLSADQGGEVSISSPKISAWEKFNLIGSYEEINDINYFGNEYIDSSSGVL